MDGPELNPVCRFWQPNFRLKAPSEQLAGDLYQNRFLFGDEASRAPMDALGVGLIGLNVTSIIVDGHGPDLLFLHGVFEKSYPVRFCFCAWENTSNNARSCVFFFLHQILGEIKSTGRSACVRGIIYNTTEVWIGMFPEMSRSCIFFVTPRERAWWIIFVGSI